MTGHSGEKSAKGGAGKENLLSHEVIKIIYDEGAKFIYADRDEGFARIRNLLGPALDEIGTSLSTAKTSNFRKLFHRGWSELVGELVPYEAVARVTEQFRKLVF